MKPVCVKCHRFYRPKCNGTFWIEGMPIKDRALAGNTEPHLWRPYKLWAGDLWECPDCLHELIVGVPFQPIAEQHEDDFQEKIIKFNAAIQINDC